MAKLGVGKTLEVFEDLGAVGVVIAGMVKNPMSIMDFFKLMALLNAAKELIVDLPAALPELADLDASETGMLAGAVYSLVEKLIKAAA